MKLAKRFTAFAVAVVMLFAVCITVSAYSYNCEEKGGFTYRDGDLEYKKYSVTSKENGHTVDAVSLEFSPVDGYFPMAFSGYSGTSGVLKTQYEIATQKYKYDVAGVINGAFFSMDNGKNPYGAYGTLVGIVISNGKIASAHSGYNDSVVAFGSDGSMNICQSKLDYKLYIKGQEINNGLYYINKTSGSLRKDGWNNSFYYYDTSCGRKADTFEICPGYEVYCKKTDSTDLIVGGTLKGEVLEVKENSYGGQLAEDKMDMSDKFILFVKKDSPNAKYVKDLAAGDAVNIAVNETIAESKDIMEHANSVISNVGWLVKDGVDMTHKDSVIGSHSVTLPARWTAFGTKPDGSYVFYCTEGGTTGDKSGSVTLRDVARAMMDMGCTNVIRMDGGGSSAMYLSDDGSGKPGYVQSSTRPVGDCILVVKKDSVQDEVLINDLKETIKKAEASVAESPNAALSEVIEEAKAVLDGFYTVTSDIRRINMKLKTAMSGKDELNNAVALASGINFKDYSPFVLDSLRKGYARAVELLGSETASLEEVAQAKENLLHWYNLKGDVTVPLTTGKHYTTSKTARTDGYADDGIRLTDGVKNIPNGGASGFSGWKVTDSELRDHVEVIVDLGEVVSSVDTFRTYQSFGDWGISEPTKTTFAVSTDNETFTEVGTGKATTTDGDGAWKNVCFSLTLDKGVPARYIKFSMYCSRGNGFIWADEVEASVSSKVVRNGIYVTNFNKPVGNNETIIFTPDYGELNADTANLNWSLNVLLRKNAETQKYEITKIWQGGGSTAARTLAEDELLIAVHHFDSPAAQENVDAVKKAKVGDPLELYGIDLDNQLLLLAPYISLGTEEPEVMYGDINGDGKITSADYVMLKRAILGTYEIPEDKAEASDFNADGKVNAKDYIMLKRYVLGTYEAK